MGGKITAHGMVQVDLAGVGPLGAFRGKVDAVTHLARMLVIDIVEVEAAGLAHTHTGARREHQAEHVALGMASGARHGEGALELGVGYRASFGHGEHRTNIDPVIDIIWRVGGEQDLIEWTLR